jgi:hypothetical protein
LPNTVTNAAHVRKPDEDRARAEALLQSADRLLKRCLLVLTGMPTDREGLVDDIRNLRNIIAGLTKAKE